MAKRYRKRKNSNLAAWTALGGLSAAGLLMLAFFAWLWVEAAGTEQFDMETHCPLSGPKSVTVFLVDSTDQISPTTLDHLKNEFRNAVSAVEKGGYLMIVELTERPGDLPVLFDSCNPGDGSTVDQWTSNPRRQQQRWEDAFGTPLSDFPDRFANGGSASQSPIMAAIQSLKLTVFDRFEATEGRKSLILASDLMEHTRIYTHYGSPTVPFQRYLDSPASREFGTRLDGIDVTVLYIDRRDRRIPWQDHTKFWEQWVERYGGRLARFVRLEGMN